MGPRTKTLGDTDLIYTDWDTTCVTKTVKSYNKKYEECRGLLGVSSKNTRYISVIMIVVQYILTEVCTFAVQHKLCALYGNL